MKEKIKLPQLRPDMKEAIFVAWIKEEGDTFSPGDALYEVETDKVINQIEADYNGKLIKKLVDEGDEIKPGDELADIERN